MFRLPFCAPLCALLVAGCSSSAPRLHQPDRIEAFCGDKAAMLTAIESIVASTNDAPEAVTIPSRDALRKVLKDSGGVVAHWNDQPLLLPKVAKSIGAAGDYVTLGDAVIPDGALSGDSRRIFLTFKTSSGPRDFALRAFDVQDVCNEGSLKS